MFTMKKLTFYGSVVTEVWLGSKVSREQMGEVKLFANQNLFTGCQFFTAEKVVIKTFLKFLKKFHIRQLRLTDFYELR